MSNHLRKTDAAIPASRNRRKKWLAMGIAGLTGVASLGMLAATNASAVTRLDDFGGHQSQDGGPGKGRERHEEGRERHEGGREGREKGREGREDRGEDGPQATSVPCDVTALFAAINKANQQLGGTLKLARGCTYELRTGTTTPTGSNALPPITTDITILGEGSALERAFDLASAAPTLFRIFQVGAGGNLRLSDVTLRNGLVTAAPGGGAVLVQAGGRAELKDVKLTQNNAAGAGVNGGAITNLGTTVLKNVKLSLNNAGASGGAVYNAGILTVENSHFEANKARTTAPAGGGAIASSAGSTSIRKSGFVGNQTSGNGGGLLLTGGSADVSDSIFRLNVALGNGGGIANTGGTLQLRNVKFVENTATLAGGALFTAGGTTTTVLPGDDTWSSELADRYRGEAGKEKDSRDETSAKGKGGRDEADEKGGNGQQSGAEGSDYDKKVEEHAGTTFYGNVAGTSGGAISNAGVLTVSDSVLLRNQAATTGGGVNNAAGGTLVVNRSILTENQAGVTGGGVNNAGVATIDVRTLVFRNNPNNCAGTAITNCQG